MYPHKTASHSSKLSCDDRDESSSQSKRPCEPPPLSKDRFQCQRRKRRVWNIPSESYVDPACPEVIYYLTPPGSYSLQVVICLENVAKAIEAERQSRHPPAAYTATQLAICKAAAHSKGSTFEVFDEYSTTVYAQGDGRKGGSKIPSMFVLGRTYQEFERIPLEARRWFSRKHCCINWRYEGLHLGEATFVLMDLGSANGTYLNGKVLNYGGVKPLQSGDLIGVSMTASGDLMLGFRFIVHYLACRTRGLDRLHQNPVETMISSSKMCSCIDCFSEWPEGKKTQVMQCLQQAGREDSNKSTAAAAATAAPFIEANTIQECQPNDAQQHHEEEDSREASLRPCKAEESVTLTQHHRRSISSTVTAETRRIRNDATTVCNNSPSSESDSSIPEEGSRDVSRPEPPVRRATDVALHSSLSMTEIRKLGSHTRSHGRKGRGKRNLLGRRRRRTPQVKQSSTEGTAIAVLGAPDLTAAAAATTAVRLPQGCAPEQLRPSKATKRGSPDRSEARRRHGLTAPARTTHAVGNKTTPTPSVASDPMALLPSATSRVHPRQARDCVGPTTTSPPSVVIPPSRLSSSSSGFLSGMVKKLNMSRRRKSHPVAPTSSSSIYL